MNGTTTPNGLIPLSRSGACVAANFEARMFMLYLLLAVVLLMFAVAAAAGMVYLLIVWWSKRNDKTMWADDEGSNVVKSLKWPDN